MNQILFDLVFLRIAREASWLSPDPSTKCGAVIVTPSMRPAVVSLGWNDFPAGTDKRQELYDNRQYKYQKIVHAEERALLNARRDVRGCMLYTWPPGPGPTCDRCASSVIEAGIMRVVGIKPRGDGFAERWGEAYARGLEWYREAGVEVVMYEESQL